MVVNECGIGRSRQDAKASISGWLGFIAVAFVLWTTGPLQALPSDSKTDFHLQWVWSVGGIDIGLKGLEVADLDADGRAEILVAVNPLASDQYWYLLERNGNEFSQVYSSLPREDGVVGVATGVEAERTRIVVAGRSSLTVYDGATRRELATFPTASAFNEALAVGDLQGDGILDAVICDSSNLNIYELLFGTARIKFGFGCVDVAIGQTDGDPQLEIALAGNSAGGFVLDSSSLTVDWADLRGFGNRLCLGDFDADGDDELASQIEGSGLRVQDPETGVLLWEELSGKVDALAAANIDAEPGNELLWGEGQWGSIHVLDGATSTELRAIENPGFGVTAITVGDTNNDGVQDVLWGTGSLIAGPDRLYAASINSTTFEARTEDWGAQFLGIAVGDFRGDGSHEVATASEVSEGGDSGGLALVLSLDNGRLSRFMRDEWSGLSGTIVDGLSAGQMDSDVELEICLTGDRSLGCFDGYTFAEQWRVSLPDAAHTLRSGQLDGDPSPELAVGTDNAFVYAFDGDTGWLKWRSPEAIPPAALLNRIRFVDVLGDARKEVLASAAQGPYSSLRVFEGGTGLIAAGPWETDHFSMNPRPDASAPEELLLGQSDGDIVPFDPLTGIAGPPIASFPGAVLGFGFADFNRDGTLDLAALLQGHFQIVDGESGATLFISPNLGTITDAADSFLVGDLDGNTVPEVLVATGAGLALFEAPLFVVFSDGFESGDTSHWQ